MWDVDPHQGALPASALDHDLATEGAGPLADAQEPERRDVGEGGLRNTGPVVPDFQDHAVAVLGQDNPDGRGAGVASGVGQGLLADAKEGDREVRPDFETLPGRLDRAPDGRALFELLGVPLERRDEAEVVQDRGPKLARDPAHVVDGLVHARAQLSDLVRDALRETANL